MTRKRQLLRARLERSGVSLVSLENTFYIERILQRTRKRPLLLRARLELSSVLESIEDML